MPSTSCSRPASACLVTGPSGAGKSTLFRAIAGIWPFGSGRVMVPKDAKVMLLPQRPYFPVATLAAAVSYPARAGTFDDARIAEVVAAVGLPEWSGKLDEEAHWNRMLSQGEQQRLAIARALLQEPDYLFLDEATASLDEPAEAALYRLLQERLKGTTIISIGHRSTLGAFHRRRIEVRLRRRRLGGPRRAAGLRGGVSEIIAKGWLRALYKRSPLARGTQSRQLSSPEAMPPLALE